MTVCSPSAASKSKKFLQALATTRRLFRRSHCVVLSCTKKYPTFSSVLLLRPTHIVSFIQAIVESLLSFNLIMAHPEVHHLFHKPIADHSFSSDRQTLAVAKDNNVELYKKSGNKFSLQDELKGHDKTVTSVDIAPNSGMIVTCSQGQSS